MTSRRRVALIGHGAIARALMERIERELPGIEVVGLIRRRSDAPAPATCRRVADIAELLALRPDLVVECAGHEALRTLGPPVLAAGVDLLVASTGALADRATEQALRSATETSCARVLLVAGAVGGLDALRAARHAGLEHVDYTGRKPPHAWRGTAAERQVDLAAVATPTVVFEGNAREAALGFPQNANVAAAIALSGLGFEATRVTLLADPAAGANLHVIEARGAFGQMRIDLAGVPLPDNPKTSRLTVGSLVAAVADPARSIVFA